MASNAWERAQDAIAHAHQRATERDENVVTPDTAVSPFDASSTTVLPHAMTSRRGPGSDPDLTQRLPHGEGGRPNGQVNGHHRDPASPEDEDEDEDATTVRFEARRSNPHPGTSPFPASPFPASPFPDGPQDTDREPERDETPAPEPERPWWKRMFGRQ